MVKNLGVCLTLILTALLLNVSCTMSSMQELENKNDKSNTVVEKAISGVTVDYTITSDWGTGFTADVKINNNSGSAINGWNVTFSFAGNQAITGYWNGRATQTGKNVSAVNESFNAQIPNGGSTTFGFQATYSGANAKPTNFDVNSGAVAVSTSSSTSKSSSSSSSSSIIKSSQPSSAPVVSYIYPDQPWYDINDKLINAHSGGMLYENGYYYWYGQDKIEGSSEKRGKTGAGIHLYRSRDLIHWNDFGIVMPVDYVNPNSDIAFGCKLQRLKVVYNPVTKKYIAYFKLYLKGAGYDVCYVGVATATSARGPFQYDHKFLATSPVNGSGDFCLYQSGNDLYHIAVRKSDRIMVVAKMTADYMYPAEDYKVMEGVRVNTEGPAIIYRDGLFHLLGSGSTGWDPNPARYYTSKSLTGPWTFHGNPCTGVNSVTGLGGNVTYGGQSCFITEVQGKDNQYIALFDVWMPDDVYNSRYIWLPFRIVNNQMSIKWIDKWNLSWFDTH